MLTEFRGRFFQIVRWKVPSGAGSWELGAGSYKLQATSYKLQATSFKLQEKAEPLLLLLAACSLQLKT
ncbi:hypothetical protein CXB36_05400 [Pseudomonas syringae pv. syringae]|nr:hypothetical protein BKC06_010365 [Pseudomonas syringae pv. syringae]PHN23197.1 hypothetical protein AO256_05060 [Pseudomonas syringae]KWS10505.1 hypothetical protein AL063_17785 [Pseudomonas syringae pv. syringae]PHX52261.1 hypothetical protein AO354_15175 [Pseudomonas syringae pv. syringae]POD58599.1 hypothetical protein BKM13_17285 [Pseudomonas syringae pv. syringae]